MTNQRRSKQELFGFSSDFHTQSLGTEWENGANRKSRDYIKWVQQSLNKIMGLRLTLDGKLGSQTRSAIRSFQQQQGLKADGTVGIQTESKLKSALAGAPGNSIHASTFMPGSTGIAEACNVLDNFDYDRDQLKSVHKEKINAIASQIANSSETAQPIRHVRITGHTDPVGSPSYNLTLGRKRAQNVAQALRDAVEHSAPGRAADINFIIESKGEDQPISRDRAKNRRVEVCIQKDARTTRPQNGAGSVPSSLDMRQPSGGGKQNPVKGRILWPALGFPAVISPHEKPSVSPFANGDATRCICVLVLTDRPYLSKEEAVRYLRIVPWAERGRRHIPMGQLGSFREEELAVRNVEKQSPLVRSNPTSTLGMLVGFGGKDDRQNRIVANLAHRVRSFYQKAGLQYLQEIRVYESTMARFRDGLYHLFWNNEKPTEQAPSDEMALLLGAFALPRRNKLGKLWQELPNFLMNEYEFEYGALHEPYRASAGGHRRRAEILHPLFVQRRSTATVRIGHLTDTHVDVRANVYEENLKQGTLELKQKGITAPISYHNWNQSFVRTYNAAKEDSDVILLTGDLIDYGRGHIGMSARKLVGDDGHYQVDRNWFLFNYLLASGDAYKRPVYTILGNHDWRLNPYPPEAMAGTPATASMLQGTLGLSKEQQKLVLRVMHGRGYEPEVSYNKAVEAKWKIKFRNASRLLPQAIQIIFGGKKNLDEPGFPTETSVESVAWYLMTINPFLDYWFTLPTGHQVLMLDWAKDENVFFGSLYQGKQYAPITPEGIKSSTDEGPKARSCLTDLQHALTREFTEIPGKAKIIGIHAPPIGPWSVWNDSELMSGWKTFDIAGKGYPFYTRKTSDGRSIKGHPLFAIRPAKGVVPDAVQGMDANFGSFESKRPEFIRRIADPKFGVRLVLSGHIHRKGMFAVYRAPASWGATLQGELFIQGLLENEVRSVRPPLTTTKKISGAALVGPLYVNGTSVGPRGHAYPAKGVSGYVDPGYAHVELTNDGTIRKAVFRWVSGTRLSVPITHQPEVSLQVA